MPTSPRIAHEDCYVDFTFTVEHEPNCELEIDDTTDTYPGGTAEIHFLYRNLIRAGEAVGTGWNIYLYDRSDTLEDGTQRPEGLKTTNPPIAGLPTATGITPSTPKLEYKPVLTASQIKSYNSGLFSNIPNDVHVGAGVSDTFWRGECRFVAPRTSDQGETNAVAIHTNTVFYGAIELIT